MNAPILLIAGIVPLPDSFIEAETSFIEGTAFTPPDMYAAAVKTFSILFIILAVILTLFYLTKRVWPRGLDFMGGDRWVRVIAATSIAPKKTVTLVEVAGEVLVLGLAGDQITMLTKVTNEQMMHHLKESETEKTGGSPFYRQIRSLLYKCGSEEEKGERLIHRITGASQKNSQGIDKITIPDVKG